MNGRAAKGDVHVQLPRQTGSYDTINLIEQNGQPTYMRADRDQAPSSPLSAASCSASTPWSSPAPPRALTGT
jgi:hypothetical protein